MKNSRKKTAYLVCNEHQYADIYPFTGREGKESKDFPRPGIDVGGELYAEVTHRAQSGWKNWKECLECCATGKTGTDVRGRGMGIAEE